MLHAMRGYVDDGANRAAGKLFADTRQACSFICSTRHGSKYYSFNARLVADARGMFANSSAGCLPLSCMCAAAGLLPRAMTADNTRVEDVACSGNDGQPVPGWCTHTVRDPEVVAQRFEGLCLDGNGRPAAQPWVQLPAPAAGGGVRPAVASAASCLRLCGAWEVGARTGPGAAAAARGCEYNAAASTCFVFQAAELPVRAGAGDALHVCWRFTERASPDPTRPDDRTRVVTSKGYCLDQNGHEFSCNDAR